MPTTHRRRFARALVLATALALTVSVSGVVAPVAPSASAAPATPASSATSAPQSSADTPAKPATKKKKTKKQRQRAWRAKVLATVASRQGKPYSYGGAGPSRFDCSGLTMWTFKRLGRNLPHSSAAQYGRTKHLRARDRRIGDLVFFRNSGGIYHVAIYAGHNMIWHAPYSGTRVRKERLWTSSVLYGRVR